MNELRRACGRTYRRLLYAALKASEGKQVLFVVGNGQEWDSINILLRDLTKWYAVKRGPGKFTFENKGSIIIKHMDSCFYGLRVDVVVVDELQGANWRAIEVYQENIKKVTKGNTA